MKFISGSINLKDFHSCKSLLEIFLSNIIEHGRSIDNDLSYKEKDKEKFYYFLFFYLKKLRPKQIVREALGIPNLFAEPKIQQRMERFSIAINYLLNSEFYKKFITTKFLNIELKYQSEFKVHAELKLLDYYIKKHLYRESLLPEILAKSPKKKKIYVAPSRMPCVDCKYLLEKVNALDYPLLFVYPKDEQVEVLKYKYYEPFFLRDLTIFTYFPDLYKIKQDIEVINSNKEEKIHHEKGKRYQILKDTDSAPRIQETSQYRMINTKFVSDFEDENFEKLILERSLIIIEKFCHFNMKKDSEDIAKKIRDYLNSLNLDYN